MDEETGLYYYAARYYNPRESVWLSVDPLAEMMPSVSPYAYTFQNPINYADPTGMIPGDPENGETGSTSSGRTEVYDDGNWYKTIDPVVVVAKKKFNYNWEPMLTGSLVGGGTTLSWLGNNNMFARAKLDAKNSTKGTSKASLYFRKTLGKKKTPRLLFKYTPKRLRIPYTGKSIPLRSNSSAALAGRSVPVAGGGLLVIGVGFSVYNISTAENPSEQAITEGFTWAGSLAGAEVGATYGAALGNVPGAFIGGVVGGVAGGFMGEKAFEPHYCNGCIRSSNNLFGRRDENRWSFAKL